MVLLGWVRAFSLAPLGQSRCHFQLSNLSNSQAPELSRRNVQRQRPVTHAFNLLHVMADLLEHFADLPVPAFGERDLEPWIL